MSLSLSVQVGCHCTVTDQLAGSSVTHMLWSIVRGLVVSLEGKQTLFNFVNSLGATVKFNSTAN